MPNRKVIWVPIICLVIASIACSVPLVDSIFKSEKTPTSSMETEGVAPGPTSTPLPLIPPTLVEVEPALGEELNPNNQITLYFDQPMDSASVEAAITMEPEIPFDLSWLDASTLRYSPSVPLELALKYKLTIKDEAKSTSGLPLASQIQLPFNTAGYLEVVQVIPQADTLDVDPSSGVTVVFNRPVIPLEIDGDSVQPLSFNPSVSGAGEWVSSSIYHFQPDDPFPGGTSIRLHIGAELEDIGGGHLSEDYEWSFYTSLPKVINADPVPGESDVPLNQEFRTTFNQAMDPLQTMQAFTLATEDGELVQGEFQWEENETVLIFRPSEFLEYDQRYSVTLSQIAQNPQGTPLTGELFFYFRTIRQPQVVSTSPLQGGIKVYNKLLSITFSTPMEEASILEAISLTPSIESLGGYWREDAKQWVVYAEFEPATSYTLTLAATAVDIMGTSIPEPMILRFSTPDLPPHLSFIRYNEVLTLTTFRPPQVDLHVRNLTQLDLSLFRLSLDQFFSLLRSSSYSYPEPTPSGDLLQQWSQPVSTSANMTEILKVPLLPGELESGPYMLIADSPDDPDRSIVRLLVVRDVELVIKSTAEVALIWAVDLSTGESVPDHVTNIYSIDGEELESGQTNADGILELEFHRQEDPYDRIFAVSSAPGEPGFGFTASTWADGINSYEFGIWTNPVPQDAEVYLYTDRPIYRQGHTVNFRGVIRDIQNDQYQLPKDSTISVSLLDYSGKILLTQSVTISTFGTFQGAFTLNQEADLGEYQIQTENGSVFFEVASYRKPDFIVSVIPSSEDVAQGDPLTVDIDAQFLFGGPVTGAEVKWRAYTTPTFPIGIPQPINWFSRASWYFPIYPFNSLANGEGMTDAQGRLTIDIPTALDNSRPQEVTIEATVTDTGGFPVTESGSVILHPALIYLALDPDRYSIRDDETALIRLSALDWDGNLIPGQVAQIDVERVLWKQAVATDGNITYESQSTLINQAFLTTADDGTILFSFAPETSGTYRVRASSKDSLGRDMQTELTIWVSGQRSRVWHQPSAERLILVPDRESYSPGDSAKIFIPSPFDEPVEALITIERRGVISHEIITVEGSESTLSIPIDENHIPNIFVSAVLIQPASQEKPESVAVGLVELDISAKSKQLNVRLTPDPNIAEPGATVTYDLLVTDSSGSPVRAEFSVALVDLAVLSLTEPNSFSPIDALYAHQTLGVRTGASVSLRAEGVQPLDAPDGLGGGGGGPAILEIRSDFPDTAFWDPSVITDENGRSQIALTLPDSLTTWRLDVRGVTTESLVGSAIVDVVSTKELLIRPITPRFFTAGDAATVAAVIHNNSDQDLSVEVRISASGAEIPDPLTHRISLPSGGLERVEWSLVIQDVDGVDLTFYASGGGLEDASKPTIGTTEDDILPVLRYSAPDTVATSGEIQDETAVIEAVNLPRRYDASHGDLRITLDPSLGAAITSALEVLESSPYDSTERLISRFLPNLYTYLAFQELGLSDPALEMRLEQTLEDALQTLYLRQGSDGGWGWWKNSASDTYLTAYSLLAISQAEIAGVQINENVLAPTIQFLRAGIIPPNLSVKADLLDRQSFVLYALAVGGEGDLHTTIQMASNRENLGIWARALLAMTLVHLDPDASELSTLISDLESNAILSATGTHWQEEEINYWNLESNIKTTSMILMALLESNPSSSSIPGAVRWLLASRNQHGIWDSSHATAWAISALTQWLNKSEYLETHYEYSLKLNGRTLSEGTASRDNIFSSIEVIKPIADLLAEQPNQVLIQRGSGDGSLFYSAHLNVFRPIDVVEATSRGLYVYRDYFTYDGECGDIDSPCPIAASASVGDDLLVRVTLIVPTDQYHIIVEDPFPAGMEPIEFRRTVSTYGEISLEETLDAVTPRVWGWWYFSQVELGDDRLTLYADHLPSGTYQYTYQLHALLPGEYRVLPTRAWANYFPEIYAQSTGEVFSISP